MKKYKTDLLIFPSIYSKHNVAILVYINIDILDRYINFKILIKLNDIFVMI